MSRRALNAVLLLAFLVSAALNWGLELQPTRPNFEFLPEMVRAVGYETFAPNPVFADGKTLQPPEPGTIPRGYLPLGYQATTADALRAGEELSNPFGEKDAGARERGALLFANFCVVCHGPNGTGDGPVAQRGYPPPASLQADKAQKMKDGQMFHVLTYGQGNMPFYATQLSRADRWKVILHVRSLQKQATVAAAGGKP